MEYTQLKYFQTVARLENISQASKELHVTQPNLSKSIARLEEELGVKLFEHRKGKIVLNDYGRVFLTSVNASFSELEKGVHTIRRMYDANQNFVRVGSCVNEILPDMLRDFSVLHPEIGIRQMECSLQTMEEQLASGAIEIAITSRKISEAEYAFDLLGEKQFVILTGPDHPLKKKSKVFIRELAKESFICDRSRMDSKMLTQICRENGFSPNIAYDVENTRLIYNLLSSNVGICFMPVAHISKIERDYPQSGIRVIQIEDELPPAILGLTYRKDYVFSNAARVLVDFVHEWIKEEHRVTQRILEGE
jgi:DNA-binding transcriptional LysR family regulator